MGKYIASIALLCAVLVSAPAKADVLSSFGFDPDKYETKAIIAYTFDGESQSLWVADPSAWDAALLNSVDLGDVVVSLLGEPYSTPLGLSVAARSENAVNGYEGFYFGYEPAELFELGAWIGIGNVLSDMMGLPEGSMPFIPLGMAWMYEDLLIENGINVMQYADGSTSYLSVALLGDLIAGGDTATVGFWDLAFMDPETGSGVPFSFVLYGIVAKDNGGESNVPEPATLALMGLGLTGLGVVRRRMKK